VIRIEQGGRKMTLLFDADTAKSLAWGIINELRKLAK
jgi:hypothetical protein